jgi:hypothetical protein
LPVLSFYKPHIYVLLVSMSSLVSTMLRMRLLLPVQVNVQMFSLSPEAVILQRPLEEVDPFFEGTWMKGFGMLYLDQNQEPHRISILLDPAADRLGKQPFMAAFDSVPLVALDVSARSARVSFVRSTWAYAMPLER